MLMKRDEGEELRPPRWELEDSSLDELSAALTEETITRARAIKLAGAALLAGTGLTMLFQSPAEARKRRRRRKKKKVTASPREVTFPNTPAGTTSDSKSVTVTNNGTEPVSVVLSPEALNGGFTLAPSFDASAPILPGTSADVPIQFTPAEQGVEYSGQLLVVDATGTTVTATDLTGRGS